MKLGIVANEFFDQKIGRMGGFGWATRQVAKFFKLQPHLGVTVVFLAGSLHSRKGLSHTRVHDTPLLFRSNGAGYRNALLEQKLDLLLTIDYRPDYRDILSILDRIPVIVWVRDPRPPHILMKQATLRIPGDEVVCPQGIRPLDCSSLSRLVSQHGPLQRSLLFTSPAPSLRCLIESTYHVSGVACAFLPNIVDIEARAVRKSDQPRFIFLGRLDPIKRPWLFVELARRFPMVEFLMLGQSHFRGRGSWTPRHLPKNIKVLGHIDGPQKIELLSSAWALVNTSIHEALATSFLEALACETPLLACTDQENLVSRFGIFTGSWDGDGMDGLPRFESGLQQLLDDRSLRIRLGQQGQEWVQRTHNGTNFLRAFNSLCVSAGLQRNHGDSVKAWPGN